MCVCVCMEWRYSQPARVVCLCYDQPRSTKRALVQKVSVPE